MCAGPVYDATETLEVNGLVELGGILVGGPGAVGDLCFHGR